MMRVRRNRATIVQSTSKRLLLLFSIALSTAPAHAGGVKLKMEPSASTMFAPARFEVRAELLGGSDTDTSLHCLSEEWTYVLAYEKVTNHETNKSYRKPPCESQTQPSSIVRHFDNSFLFSSVGRYSIRLQLRNPEGKVVANGSVNVRVLEPSIPQWQ